MRSWCGRGKRSTARSGGSKVPTWPARVLAVEDTSTTGASPLTAVDALREAGAEVVGVAVLVNRGARENVTRRGLVYRAAYELADLGV